MRYSENLHLNLPEDSDPLEIDKISENFEVLDGAIKEQSKASGYQVGDTLTTWRTGVEVPCCSMILPSPSST